MCLPNSLRKHLVCWLGTHRFCCCCCFFGCWYFHFITSVLCLFILWFSMSSLSLSFSFSMCSYVSSHICKFANSHSPFDHIYNLFFELTAESVTFQGGKGALICFGGLQKYFPKGSGEFFSNIHAECKLEENQVNRCYLLIQWNKLTQNFLKRTNFNIASSQELCALLCRSSQWWVSVDTEIKVCFAQKSELPKILSLQPTTRASFFLLSAIRLHSASHFQTGTVEQGTVSNFVSGIMISEKDTSHTSCIHFRHADLRGCPPS